MKCVWIFSLVKIQLNFSLLHLWDHHSTVMSWYSGSGLKNKHSNLSRILKKFVYPGQLPYDLTAKTTSNKLKSIFPWMLSSSLIWIYLIKQCQLFSHSLFFFHCFSLGFYHYFQAGNKWWVINKQHRSEIKVYFLLLTCTGVVWKL